MWLRRKLLGRDLARHWAHRAGDTDQEPRATRVLLEESDGAEAFAYWRLLSDAGYQVEWCPGPEGPLGGRCPLVSRGRCELVERADVVVSSLGIDEQPCRDVLDAIRRMHPETPVIVQASRREFTRWSDMFEGNSVLRTPVTGRALLDSVESVLTPGGVCA